MEEEEEEEEEKYNYYVDYSMKKEGREENCDKQEMEMEVEERR